MLGPQGLAAQERNAAEPSAPPVRGGVELFAGMKSGELDVKFIPKNDRQGRLLVKNVAKRPLSVQLPAAMAARPVLAQFNMGAGVGMTGSMGGQNNANAPQAMGIGGPQSNQNRPRGLIGNRGFLNIEPEQLIEMKLDTVCLEHGKREPKPRNTYELCPVEEVTSAPGVSELLARLGAGAIDQRACQAAAWHLASGMSWSDLAAKRIERLNAESEPYFMSGELEAAADAVEQVQKSRDNAASLAGSPSAGPR